MNDASSGTITLSNGNNNVPSENTNETVSNEYDIFVDGNLFLDNSVFSQSQGLSIAAGVSIAAEIVNLTSFDKQPPIPDLSKTTIITNPRSSINAIGDTLIFSALPITGGAIEATGAIYVGNYSNLKGCAMTGFANTESDDDFEFD